MCGIFGAINTDGRNKIDTGILRALALVNRERGTDALGFFDSTEAIYKRADDPINVLTEDDCTEWLDRAEQEAWFVVGHTRNGTRGENTDENSHPFKYGSVIGSHNGIVDAPKDYIVDSEYCIDLLDQKKSNYQTALEDMWGYWTLSWYDNRKEELFITMHDNMCGVAKYKGAWYFSSDPDHVASVIGSRETIIMKTGQSMSFDKLGRMKWLKKFKHNVSYSYKKDYRTGTKFTSTKYNSDTDYSVLGNHNHDYATKGWPEGKVKSTGYVGVNDPDNQIREYDSDFANLWLEYADTDADC